MRKKQLEEELLKRCGGTPPALKALQEGEEFSPSLQNEMEAQSGLWPFLQIWDGRQLKLELEKEQEG